MRRIALITTCLAAAIMLLGSNCGGPSTPTKPLGNATPVKNGLEAYTTSSTEAGKQIQYVFNWNNNHYDTTGLLASGDKASAELFWPATGSFSVKAMAIDQGGKASGWSDPLAVKVGDYTQPSPPDTIGGLDVGAPHNDIVIWAWQKTPLSTDSISFRFYHPGSSKNMSDWLKVAAGDTAYDTLNYGAQGSDSVWAVIKDKANALSVSSQVKHVTIGPVALAWAYSTPDQEDFTFCAPILQSTSNIVIFSADVFENIYSFADAGGHPVVKTVPTATGAAASGSPVLSSDGAYLFVPVENSIYTLKTSDLSQVWVYTNTDSPKVEFGTVAIKGNNLYAGRANGDLFYFDVSNGALTYHDMYPTGSQIGYPPVIGSNGNVYFGNDSGVTCLDASAKFVSRNSLSGTAATSGLAIDATGNIWVGSDNGHLRKLSPTLDSLFASDSTNSDILGCPLIDASSNVYATREDGRVLAVNNSGVQLWEQQIPDAIGNSFGGTAVLAPDSTIVCLTNENGLIALKTSSGLRDWEYPIPVPEKKAPRFNQEDHPSLTIGPTYGRIYVGTAEGFYAIKVDKASYAVSNPLAGAAWPKFQKDLANSGSVTPTRAY